jgi:hypothetical protein
MQDIVADNRRSAVRPTSVLPTVRVDGAVQVAPQPSTNGWYEPARIKDWKAPGIDIVDRLCDLQDQIDRAARARELGQAAAALQKGKQE